MIYMQTYFVIFNETFCEKEENVTVAGYKTYSKIGITEREVVYVFL